MYCNGDDEMTDQQRIDAFQKELAALSKKYKITINGSGIVSVCSEDFDLSDLEYTNFGSHDDLYVKPE